MRSITRAADGFDALVDRAAALYRRTGRYAWHFARGKLRHDPLFEYVLERGLVPDRGTVLDLGCGYALMFACLAASRASARNALSLHGVELHAGRVRVAREALGAFAQIDRGDLRTAAFPAAALVLIADVLLYLDREDQDRVLDRVVATLQDGGTLLLREADRSAGLLFHVTAWTERVLQALRRAPGRKLCYRAAAEWETALRERGLSVEAVPMDAGTPFANVLYIARKAKPAAPH